MGQNLLFLQYCWKFLLFHWGLQLLKHRLSRWQRKPQTPCYSGRVHSERFLWARLLQSEFEGRFQPPHEYRTWGELQIDWLWEGLEPKVSHKAEGDNRRWGRGGLPKFVPSS